MSFSNDGFNTTSNAMGRNDGFNQVDDGLQSYGPGTGSGAYDPANTGLGGYGSGQQRSSDNSQLDSFGNRDRDQNRMNLGGNDFGTDDFDSSNTGGALGRDRNADRQHKLLERRIWSHLSTGD